MRYKLMTAVILLSGLAEAKQPARYESGTLLQMDSAPCGVDEKDAKSLTGEIIGTDSGHKKTHELLCQEYLLQSDRAIYRIRPRDEKHPALLPIGEKAQFRIEKDKLRLRVEDGDDKERDYSVVSITLRSEKVSEK